MDIKQLRYFVEVARREHISDAALELNIARLRLVVKSLNSKKNWG